MHSSCRQRCDFEHAPRASRITLREASCQNWRQLFLAAAPVVKVQQRACAAVLSNWQLVCPTSGAAS